MTESLIKSLKLYPFQLRKSTIEPFTNVANVANVREPISQITNNIFLGNMLGAENSTIMNNNNIKYIINCTRTIPNYFESNYTYLRIPIDDTFSQHIENYFDITYDFITKAIDNNNNIFIHCHAGVSRSATILIAYLMRKNNIDVNTALNIVKNKRSIINPNIEFMDALNNYKPHNILNSSPQL